MNWDRTICISLQALGFAVIGQPKGLSLREHVR